MKKDSPMRTTICRRPLQLSSTSVEVSSCRPGFTKNVPSSQSREQPGTKSAG